MIRWQTGSTGYLQSPALCTGNVRWWDRDSNMAAVALERPEKCGQRDEDIELSAHASVRIVDDILVGQQALRKVFGENFSSCPTSL